MFEAGLLSEFGFLVSFWHPRIFSQGLDSREQPGYVWPCGYVQARTGFWVRPAQQRPFDLIIIIIIIMMIIMIIIIIMALMNIPTKLALLRYMS